MYNSIYAYCSSLKVYMSTRTGAWVIRQVSDNGLPVDMKYNTRFIHILFQLLPINFFNWYGENKLNAMYDHTMYALRPNHRQVVTQLSSLSSQRAMDWLPVVSLECLSLPL